MIGEDASLSRQALQHEHAAILELDSRPCDEVATVTDTRKPCLDPAEAPEVSVGTQEDVQSTLGRTSSNSSGSIGTKPERR